MQTRFKEKLINWQALVDTLGPKLGDLPHLTPDHAALTALLQRARDLQKNQEIALSQLRDVNRQRTEVSKEGSDLNGRIAHGLKHALGVVSEKLLEFGVKPRARVIRRKRLTAQQRAARDASKAALAAIPPAAPPPATGQPPKPAA
jgi:hypothetical protein